MKYRIGFILLAGIWAISITASAQSAKSVWDGVFTTEQAKRGEDTFTKECSSCHGNDLAGDGFAPALAGSDFMSNWNELSVGDLYDRIRISMPPNGPSNVSPAAKADIVAHILDFNKYPAGQAELEPKTEVLKGIKIEMKK